ncbi:MULTISPECIES: tyrosine-type recombinase/integrase [Dethiosulfovibrio]|uniref:Tyrosine-type recombinase/integrase n=2 Tax=Dethiosulfovibrio TaxID=47054 RepID=A0ABS9ETR3_9BACT|nr:MULTISPECIES: tyrosine-type recombinase/integrase [Dethiosulfovibrio]MCF4113400.1 tyrosine-type recombinase/integrase [Dethiosulfovibrio russensis]MCF4144024.1 tyrosine-type recombinase/integrase [Dethiosulfovibrio acidaminovorans]
MITDVEIRKTKPGDRVIRLVDERGLSLEIRPTGRKVWKLRIWKNGKESKKTLGEYPGVSLMRARQIRDEIKSSSTSPTDTTFAKLAHEWLDVRMRPTKAPRYIETLVYKIDTLLIPHIGDKIVRSLTAPELLQVIRKIEARGTIETARRTRQMCGQILRYGVATGRCDRDVAADLKGALQPVKTTHMATIIDPARIGQLMRDIDTGLVGQIKYALLFQAYTFARPGELRKAEWIEFDGATWKIPAEKMKMKRVHWVPLSRQTVEVLNKLKEISGKSRYLFPSIRSTVKPMSDATVLAALRRLGYTQEEMTGHGFRSMFSTIANEHGWPPDVIERQLAHVQKNQVRAAYNHAEYILQRRELMQWWADWLDEQREDIRP